MTEFQTVLNEWSRMCNALDCDRCAIGMITGDIVGVTCASWVIGHPAKAETLIMQWSKAHPIMTNGKKFEEIFGISGRDVVAINKLAWLEEEYKGG